VGILHIWTNSRWQAVLGKRFEELVALIAEIVSFVLVCGEICTRSDSDSGPSYPRAAIAKVGTHED